MKLFRKDKRHLLTLKGRKTDVKKMWFSDESTHCEAVNCNAAGKLGASENQSSTLEDEFCELMECESKGQEAEQEASDQEVCVTQTQG